MPRPPLPPYLTSGASSRAHHSLLVRLHDAISTQDEHSAIAAELDRCKRVLGDNNQSTVSDRSWLSVVLDGREVADGLEWALVPALQLAAGGRSLKERRIGYLFLSERLPPNHELGLLLINTIRKDLTSSIPSHVLLALHTIVKLPSHDLSPAVTPILASKPLLKHKEAAIRQRTLQALVALHLLPGVQVQSFPLSMSRIIKYLDAESDASVLAVLLRLIGRLIKTGVHPIQTEDERVYLVERILESARLNHVSPDRQLALDYIRLLGHTLDVASDAPRAMVEQYVGARLEGLRDLKGWEGAYLLEACRLVAQHSTSSLVDPCFHFVSRLLSPSAPTASSSSPAASVLAPAPDDHVLALRCLEQLKDEAWGGRMGERQMSAVMQGLNSPDDTIRRATLTLLHQADPSLTRTAFDHLVISLRNNLDLHLPLSLPPDADIGRKTRAGRAETAGRALEVAEIRTSEGITSAWEAKQAGGEYAGMIRELMGALQEGSEGDEVAAVWEEGEILLNPLDQETLSLSSSPPSPSPLPSPTLAVIRSSVACEHAALTSEEEARRALETLLSDLDTPSGSVQELVLVALLAVCAAAPALAQSKEVVARLKGKKEDRSAYLQKRFAQALFVLEGGLLDEVVSAAKSRTLPDLLAAMIRVHASHAKSSLSQTNSGSATPPASASANSALAFSPPAQPRQLRYDAYAPPSASMASSLVSARSGRMPGDDRSRSTSRARAGRDRDGGGGGGGGYSDSPFRTSPSISAGDFALLEAEATESADMDPHSRSKHETLGLALNGLSLDVHAQDPDPFASEDPRTPTMR
ncbi:hypothetical protein EHS25_001372 [Saitozyma podzolica]|uniref:Clathrin/coatomer adaptor adaptin-like N-terminal domain-containing protein n=1 Tax=Saitozyma podzolica TaxID=1890683 RepID=A0A427YFT8_9TREE|nr:hypothetical protein EHS25_001372 [Saitozyma podzolica]